MPLTASKVCKQELCDPDSAIIRKGSTSPDYNFNAHGSHFPALHHRLLLWTCPAECDYTCQHIITQKRLTRDPPMLEPIVQYHGKWPFHRFLGMQEPFSVLFSLFNYLAHRNGLRRLADRVPASYSLMPYYQMFGYFGLASWIFSMIFHTRDFNITEKLDYFAAGASVLYGLYLAVVRVFRLDLTTTSEKQSLLRIWTATCCLLYLAHVSYLTLWSWDYTYNMAANVAVGVVQNLLWSWFSVTRYRRLQKTWAAWPGLIVAWIIMAMSLELFDFPPWGGMVDAHSLWHLGTVVPTVWWYRFVSPPFASLLDFIP
jgi:post-GPI attachment to proteins factor 3